MNKFCKRFVLLQFTPALSNYYKLRQLLVLLQITATHYYKLQDVLQIATLLQITPQRYQLKQIKEIPKTTYKLFKILFEDSGHYNHLLSFYIKFILHSAKMN